MNGIWRHTRRYAAGITLFMRRERTNRQNPEILEEVVKQEKMLEVFKEHRNIKGRFGKNAILRASSLQEEGTMQFRNTLVGGHNGE